MKSHLVNKLKLSSISNMVRSFHHKTHSFIYLFKVNKPKKIIKNQEISFSQPHYHIKSLNHKPLQFPQIINKLQKIKDLFIKYKSLLYKMFKNNNPLARISIKSAFSLSNAIKDKKKQIIFAITLEFIKIKKNKVYFSLHQSLKFYTTNN